MTLKSAILDLPLPLDRASTVPLYRQLYESVRAAILAGRLRGGTRLPATRTLAETLGLSRASVVNAYELLFAEGYVTGSVGSGTYVATVLPDALLTAGTAQPPASLTLPTRPASLGAVDTGAPRAFRAGIPALDMSPLAEWERVAARRLRRLPRELLAYGDPAGYLPLREALADYLGASRAVVCHPDRIIIVAGAQQGLDLAARVLLAPGDAVWLEDPGYAGTREAWRAAGARLVPVPVDAEGLDPAAGEALAPAARLAYVTPSHQYPTGTTMPLPRRLALLDWARRAESWIVEDDYDSEFRYAGRPLPAMQGLQSDSRVIYVGSFSKVLFPGLRLGYLVVPDSLVEAFLRTRLYMDRHPPAIDQAILADYLAEGYFVRHIRRMRKLYATRQAALVEAARRELSGRLDVQPAEAGLHLVGWLPPGADDRATEQLAAAHGVEAPALSGYATLPLARPGLLLGYAAIPEPAIRAGVTALARALAGS